MDVPGEWIQSKADELAIEKGCYFDLEAADRVRHFFVKYLRHSKGEYAGKPFELLDWQWQRFIAPLFGWRRADGTRRFRRGYCGIPKKNGKLLDVLTPIPTPSGWTTMGDIGVGDTVFDERGEPCNVVAVSEIEPNPTAYRLTFSDGYTINADAGHQWVTQIVNREYRSVVSTTEEIKRSLKVGNSNVNNHRIPCTLPLNTPDVILPIPPYVLGAWLGDGNSANGGLTNDTRDDHIVKKVESFGVVANRRPVKNRVETYGRYILEGLSAKLRALGLKNNKHIPAIYLRASARQRWELLQGLMDTDGYASEAGQCEYVSISLQLARDVNELMLSLGLLPRASVADATYYGVVKSRKFRLLFYAYADQPVFSMPRKQNRLKPRPSHERALKRSIVSVESVPPVPMKCIEVDSPSRCYLAGKGMIPTHNSTLGAGITLYLLVGDGERGAEIYSAAADRRQASIVFNEAAAMVRSSPVLSDRIYVINSKKRMEFRATNSTYEALSADVKTKEGINLHGLIFDELHAQPNRLLYDTLRYAGAARRQPLSIAITTAGFDRTSICYEQYRYAKAVLAGEIDDAEYFALIYEADEQDDWKQPETWRKANPSYGITLREDDFVANVREAERNPAVENSFKRYKLNLWTEQETRWLSVESWRACERKIVTTSLRDKLCYAGLDLASTSDLNALTLWFPESKTIVPYFWVPQGMLRKRRLEGKTDIAKWCDQGYIKVTSGDVTDYDIIRDDINALGEKHEIRDIALDRWNALQIAVQLQNDGFTVVLFGQGFFSMSAPTKELERLILSKQLRHAKNPVMDWMIRNVTVESDSADNKKPSKKKSADKIDGVTAAIMAIGRAMAEEDEREGYG